MSEPENPQKLSQSVEEAILKTISQPKKIQSEADSVEQHSIAELIAADKYLRQKEAAKKGNTFRLIKVINE
jgi:hypothetical protein